MNRRVKFCVGELIVAAGLWMMALAFGAAESRPTTGVVGVTEVDWEERECVARRRYAREFVEVLRAEGLTIAAPGDEKDPGDAVEARSVPFDRVGQDKDR